MPNWCSNTVRIEGRSSILRELQKQVRSIPGDLPDTEFCLKKIILYAGDWDYNWCLTNWGTKWDVKTHTVREDLNETEGWLEYSFDSAWGPPIKALKTLSRQYPTVRVGIAYDEAGCDFGGYNIYQDGMTTSQVEGSSRSWSWADTMLYRFEELS